MLCGCIEYQPDTTLPDVGAFNPRELDGTTQTDAIVQAPIAKVDVLWIVDNSSSMEEEQDGIAANFPVFLNYFVGSGLDYHIGVISTDIEDPEHRGRLVQRAGHKWVDSATPWPEEILSQMTRLGIEGSGDERGRDPIWLSMTEHRDDWNAGFYRPEAALHMIVISDEEDSSDLIGEHEWLEMMEDLKWGEDQLTFSSIVAPDPICPGANDPGVEYIRYTNRLGGIYWPICDDDWATVLEQLGLQAAGQKREYFLSRVPVPETIQVSVTLGATIFPFDEGDFTFDPVRNSVSFVEYLPDPGVTVTITYDVAASDLDRD